METGLDNGGSGEQVPPRDANSNRVGQVFCWELSMEILILFVLVGVPVMGFFLWNDAQQKKRREGLYAEAAKFMAGVEMQRGLRPVATNLNLQRGERAFYFGPSALHETRAVREYVSASSGFKVAKGVYVGGTKGRSVSTQEWNRIAAGTLTITDKRIVFTGDGESRTVPLSKLMSLGASVDGVEIAVEGRQKSMRFEAPNSLIVQGIIKICAQAKDPQDLSQSTLKISFDGDPVTELRQEIVCPSCKTTLLRPGGAVGEIASCSQCGGDFTLP